MTFPRTTVLTCFITSVMVFAGLGISVADAKSVVRSGDAVSVAEEQVIEGDFYGAAGTVNLSGSVNGDAVMAGGQINVNGTVSADALLIGGSVDVAGSIGDDVRVVAGEVTLSEPIQGDVFIIGGMVNILSTASVAGDVVVFAGQVTIEGSVGGNILGSVESLRIDAPVSGNVDVTVNQLTLGDRANIEGSVQYVSTQLAIQALNATVGGELVRSDPVLPAADMDVRSALIPIFVLLFSVLAWFLVSKRTLAKVATRALTASPRPVLFGTLVTILTPFAVVVLFASMIGVMVSFFVFFAYASILVLGMVGASAVVGQLLMKVFNQPSAHVSLVTILVGVVGSSLLMLLPVLGQIILLGFTLLTIGAIVDLLLRPQVK